MLMTEALPEPAVIAEDKAEVGRRTPPVLLTREPLVLEAVVPVCCEDTISKVMLEFSVCLYLRRCTWRRWCPCHASADQA